MWKQHIWNEEIQNLIISIFPILTNKVNNSVHFRLSNAAKILSDHRPSSAIILVFVDGSTLTDGSLRYLDSNIILFSHDISYSIVIYVIISFILYNQWIRLQSVKAVWYIITAFVPHFEGFHNLLIILIRHFIESNQIPSYCNYLLLLLGKVFPVWANDFDLSIMAKFSQWPLKLSYF